MVAKRENGPHSMGWLLMTLWLLSLYYGGAVRAESTLERKMLTDEELSFAEIVKMLKEVKVNGEVQQATLETLARAIADIVGDLAVIKAEKEEPIPVDFGALGDSYACFARCFEFLVRGISNISRDIGAQLWRSWSQWDVVLKTVMSLMAFHVLSSLQGACMNSLRALRKGWKAVQSASGLITGVIRWSRKIPVKDDIEAYKQLISVTRYPGESQAEFIDKLVNKWKALSSRLSDSRLLEILQQHFPREFLNTIYELDLNTVAAEVVLRKWNSYVKIHKLRDANRVRDRAAESGDRPLQTPVRRQNPRQVGRRAGRAGKCFRCNGDHEVKECSWPADIVCNFCKKSGHVKAACRKLHGRVNAVANPLFDQGSDIFDDASIVTDPCLEEGVAPVEYRRDEGTSSAAVNSLIPAVCAAMPANKAFADLQVQTIGRTRCLLDTGAAVSVISAHRLKGKSIASVDRKKKTQLKGFNQSIQDTQGVILLGVKHGNARCRIPFHVIEEDIETIVGYNALKKLRTVWDIGSDRATMGGSEVTLTSTNFKGQ